jgi:hypothetical protein
MRKSKSGTITSLAGRYWRPGPATFPDAATSNLYAAGCGLMNERYRQRYRDLCELSEIQNDPEKLTKLREQIHRMLELEIIRLKKAIATQSLTVQNSKPSL